MEAMPRNQQAPAQAGTEPCYACDGTGKFSDVAIALGGIVIHGSCSVCRGTGQVACICRADAEAHYVTCPTRMAAASRVAANKYPTKGHATNGNYGA